LLVAANPSLFARRKFAKRPFIERAFFIVTFTTPVTSFGAFWGYAANETLTNETITFYDASHQVIDVPQMFTYSAAGTGVLAWEGYSSTTSIASVFHHADRGEHALSGR
jgi:hypothetical protein